jgi:hypothetical protein
MLVTMIPECLRRNVQGAGLRRPPRVDSSVSSRSCRQRSRPVAGSSAADGYVETSAEGLSTAGEPA